MWVPVRHAESLLLESGRQQLICKELIVAAYQAIRKLTEKRGMFRKLLPSVGRMLWKIHLVVTPAIRQL
jgi:hypothetical protein